MEKDIHKKIVVVGGGNAGCLTALHYGWHSRKNDAISVELIYNPDVKPEPVGQATLVDPPALLYATTRTNWMNNPIHATMKSGILYEGWGKKQDVITNPFPMDRMGMHYCPCEMQELVLKTGLFKVTEGDVDPKDIDADLVFDCRGTPDDISPQNGYRELVNPTNAAILAKPNWNTLECTYSRHVATPDGWTFIIPTHPESPSYEYSVGYCYNSNITSKEDAEKNFLDQFDVEITQHKEYKSYISTKPVDDDGRIFLNGNRLCFLEPLESTGAQIYMDWASVVGESVFLKKNSIEEGVSSLKGYIYQIERYIHWHYQFGSKYDTPFWDYAKSLKLTNYEPNFDKVARWSDETSWDDIMVPEYGGIGDIKYGQWSPISFKYWMEGVGYKPPAKTDLSKLWIPQGGEGLDLTGKEVHGDDNSFWKP